MKIDVNGAYRAYTKNNVVSTPKSRDGQKEGRVSSAQQDRVSISSAAHKNDIDRLVYSAAAEVEAKVSPARIAELKQAVGAGEYRVPTEKLAEAVLNTYI